MTARDKTSRRTMPAQANESAAPAERFARVLRTALVEVTVKPSVPPFKHVAFTTDIRLLWAQVESDWHRHIGHCVLKAPATH